MKKREPGKKRIAGKIVVGVIAVLIALYGVTYLAITFATGDPLPMPFGFGSAVVLTGSMEPVLSPNDLIFVVKSRNYAVGDVVVFTTGGTPVVHRVIQSDAESGLLVTKGDANNIPDDPVPVSRVKGKMLFFVPFVGVIPRFVRTVPGMIIVLMLLFTLLYLSVHTRAQEEEEEERAARLEEEVERLKKEMGLSARSRYIEGHKTLVHEHKAGARPTAPDAAPEERGKESR